MIHTELRVRRSLFSKTKSILLVSFSFALILGNVSFVVPTLFGQVANAVTVLPAPILDQPTNDVAMNGTLVTNKWFPVGGATKYVYRSYYDSKATQSRYRVVTKSTSKSAVNVENGAFWWRVRAIDAAGVKGKWSQLRKVTIDNSTPTVPVNVHITSAVTDKNIAWAWDESTDTDGSGVKGYYYQLTKDGSEVTPATFTTETTIVTPVVDDGGYQLNVYAADNAGNQSATASGGVTIDSTAPMITITNNGFSNKTIQPTVEVTGDPVSYVWTTSVPSTDVSISDTAIAEPVFTISNDGTYEFTLTVTDAVGNQSAQQFSFTYKTPAPVIISTQTIPVVPEVATFVPAAEPTTSSTGTTSPTTNQAGTGTDIVPNSNDTATKDVLGAQTKNEGEVLGNETVAVVAPTTQGWKVLGILWYWWALIFAAIAGIWWFLAARRKTQAQDV